MLVIKKSVFVFFCALVPFVINDNINFNMRSSLRFSTKNPYYFKELNNLNYNDFTPKKIWAIYRHGTRFPGKKTISKYIGLIDHIDTLKDASFLTSDEKSAFEKWKPLTIDLNHQKFLTKEGEEELYNLGTRFRSQFMNNFKEDQANITIKHTPTQRTNISARKFVEGLFQSTANNHKIVEVARDDIILRPYKGCPLWRKTVKKNPATLKEKISLIESVTVENLINEMREMTQIKDLDFADIELIYNVCGFETAWRHLPHNGKSIWCSLFKNEQHIDIMEYLEDMEYYWVDGPGFEITRKIACRTVDDMLNQLDPSHGMQSLSFYFTHSGTILKLLTFLELYKDDFQLTADKLNYQRLWRTSYIDSFASNIVVVLYESNKYGPHIQFLHQENVVEIPNCKVNEFGMCSYHEFRGFYENKIKECNLSTICNRKDEL
ncbi:hypothetical protein ACKWTF_005868 [Chironomus riparius]